MKLSGSDMMASSLASRRALGLVCVAALASALAPAPKPRARRAAPTAPAVLQGLGAAALAASLFASPAFAGQSEAVRQAGAG